MLEANEHWYEFQMVQNQNQR